MILPPLLSDGEAEIPLLSAVLPSLLCGFGTRGSEYQIRGSECDVRLVRSHDSLIRSEKSLIRSEESLVLLFRMLVSRWGFFRKPTSFSFSLNEGFFLKSPRPSLPLKRAPPLISVFSPQGRRGNRSSSSLVTISFYGWRTIRGLASSRAAFCGMRPHGQRRTKWLQKAQKPIAAHPDGQETHSSTP